MPNKIRLGFIGANVKSTWASQSHFPALQNHPDVEWTAVCTRNADSAEAARKAFGARIAFTDFRAMAASPGLLLHAAKVIVPFSSQSPRIEVTAPLPEAMTGFLEGLRLGDVLATARQGDIRVDTGSSDNH